MGESQVQNAILEYLQLMKVFAWRNNNVPVFDSKRGIYRKMGKWSISGISDVLGIFRGRLLAIEVKGPKGYATKEQKAFLERVNEEGGVGFVARSIEDVITKLKGEV